MLSEKLSWKELNALTNILQKVRKSFEIQFYRESDKEFDIHIEYGFELQEGDHKVSGSAWLPLSFIKHMMVWTHPDCAELSDYPSMVVSGDWSGIRDSSKEVIWRIFEHGMAGYWRN